MRKPIPIIQKEMKLPKNQGELPVEKEVFSFGLTFTIRERLKETAKRLTMGRPMRKKRMENGRFPHKWKKGEGGG